MKNKSIAVFAALAEGIVVSSAVMTMTALTLDRLAVPLKGLASSQTWEVVILTTSFAMGVAFAAFARALAQRIS